MPANGETVTVTTNPSVPVDISLNLLKREMALGGLFVDCLGMCLFHSEQQSGIKSVFGKDGLGTVCPRSFTFSTLFIPDILS